MKGIVGEGEEVAVIYIDGKPSAKYAKKHEAERDAEFMRKRHPNKKIEIKHEVRETEAIKGADGKRCWKGKRYAGTENGKDKCIPVKEFAGDEKSEQPKQEHPITVYIHSIVDNTTIALIGEKMSELKHGKIKTQFTLPNSGTTYTEWLPVVDKKYPTGKLSSNVNLSSSQMPSVRLNDGVFLYWAYDPQLSEGDVVPFKKKTDKDKYNTAIAKQRGSLPISYIDPDAGITVKSTKPGDPIQIPDEYQDINLKSKIRGVPKQNQTNFEVWGNDHGYYVFGNNTNAVLSAWPNGEMMVLSDPSDSKGRENCQRFAKQVMKPIDLDSLRPKLKNKILQKMSMIDQSVNEGVIVGHDANDPEVAILGGAGTMSLSRLKKKVQGEAEQLANDLARGRFKAAAYNIKQLQNTLNTIVAAEDEMSKKYFGENAWNQLGQRKPNTNLPAPERGSRVNHGKRFEEGDIVLPLSGPLKGQPHKVIHSQRTSIRIVPLGRDSYPGDTIAPRTKHEWVVPADMNEDYTEEFAAEKTCETNPYGGQEDRQFRGAISETPTDNPTGTSTEGGWRRTDLDEYREMSPALRAAQQNLIALRNKEKSVNVPGKRERAPRDKVELDKPKPASVLTKGAQEVDPDTMDAIAAFLAKGGEIKKGRPGKAPPTGRQQASKHIGGGGKYRKKSDTPGQGANYRGAAIVAVEEEQLDEKCWTGYKQVGMKKKGGKEVPNCVPKESAIMKGLKR